MQGYLVGMSGQDYDPPYELQPGQLLRLSAVYDADQPYKGKPGFLNEHGFGSNSMMFASPSLTT